MELTEARELAKHELEFQGLDDWTVAFNNHKTSAGLCNHALSRIELSRAYTEQGSDEQVINTILHEVAHALTKGHGHDRIWKQKAIALGCSGNRTINVELDLDYKWIGTCGCKDFKWKRHKLTLRARNGYCPK